MNEEIERELQALLTLITRNKVVRSVILFGSTATGKRKDKSDIDLLVLVDGEGVDAQTLAARIRRESIGLLSLPLDLVVEPLAHYQERIALPTLERKISREGKVVYAA